MLSKVYLIAKSASRQAIRSSAKRLSPCRALTPRYQHTAASKPIQSVDTGKIKKDTQISSHRDPDKDSQSSKFIDQFSPYLLTTYSRPPVIFTRGQGSYIWDLENRKYIDFTAGIAVVALGHADPQIAKLLQDQALELIHCSNLYHSPWPARLAELIVNTTQKLHPNSPLSKIFFTNSGTEANEGALKFARKLGKIRGGDGKTGIVCFERGFHGRTFGALSVTAQSKYQAPFAPLVPGVKVGKLNDVDALEELIGEDTCGVIVEPIQGEGGVFEASEEFLTALRKRCDEVGSVLIYDEIQCGLSRTGKLWAHNHFPVELSPDILTMAKPLANGFPIGAVLSSEAVAREIKVGDHGTTFGGNPLATRLAHHVFERLSSPETLNQVATTSQLIISRLRQLEQQFPDMIDGIRGRGLILGLQIKSLHDKDAATIANSIVGHARQRGLLIITAGEGTIRLVPPLNIPEDVVLEGLGILEGAIEDASRTGA